MLSTKPRLIFVDGTDGSGKSTTVSHLKVILGGDKPENIKTCSFPGHNVFGQMTRPWFVNDSQPEHIKLFAILTEFSLFMEDYLAGKYNDYTHVICDRFILSTIHQTNSDERFVDMVKEVVKHYELQYYLYFITTLTADDCLARLEARGDINDGDRKALAEAERTNFYDYSEKLGFRCSIVQLENKGTKLDLFNRLDSFFEENPK